jgi:hypothetical protein
MTFQQACERAARIARKTESFRYVFLEDAVCGEYEIGSDFDCGTWFQGSDPVACFGPDGQPG